MVARGCLSILANFGLINHSEFVKKLMDYLEFLYFGKGNVSRMFEMCKAFYRPEKQDRSLIAYFVEFNKTYEELNMLFLFSPDIKVQQAQREHMAVMGFLAGLPSEFDSIKSQILSSFEIPSLRDTFRCILHAESSPSVQMNSTLAGRNNGYKPVK